MVEISAKYWSTCKTRSRSLLKSLQYLGQHVEQGQRHCRNLPI